MIASIVVAQPALAANPETTPTPTHAESREPASFYVSEQASLLKQKPRVHDGFYVRLSAGGGIVGVDLNPESGYANHSADGAVFALDLQVGASPVRGGTLGGALLFDLAPSMALASDREEGTDAPLWSAVLGPFVDAFPDPKSGWHFGGTLGLAGLSVQTVDSTRHRLVGVGGAIWAGHDFWVGDAWSMGGALRVLRTLTKGDADEHELDASSLAAILMLSTVHH